MSGGATASFGYDGDGKRVTATVSGGVTVYVGDYYEYSNGVASTYYSLGGQRVAMRDGLTVSWLLTDHLGSSTIDADASAVRQAEMR